MAPIRRHFDVQQQTRKVPFGGTLRDIPKDGCKGGYATNRPNGYEVGETIENIYFPFSHNVIENITTPTHSVDVLLSPRYPRCSKQRWRLSEEAQCITSAIEGENGAVRKVFREKPST